MRAHTLIVPDTHGEHVDWARARELARWKRAMRPRRTIHIGDAVDAYGLSRFGKRLDIGSRSWAEERKAVIALMKLLGVEIYLAGNHEDRGRKRGEERPFEAPYYPDPFAALAKELGIRYVPSGMLLERSRLICHGEHGGLPARAEGKARKTGLSVLQCHSHALRLNWLGPDWWAVEGGHLVDPKAPVFGYSAGAAAGLNGWRSGFPWLDMKGGPHIEAL